MFNTIVKALSGKDIILYDKHRQTLPLVNNAANREKYWFLPIAAIWKYIPFKTADKRKHRIMFIILNIIDPKYILSINWLSKRESLYKVWTSKNSGSKFIVVQHGSYVGGIVTDIPHKYTKCDVFFTWGNYFKEQFKAYNSLKKLNVLSFGNTIYNEYNRSKFDYTTNKSNKILLAPTALNKYDLSHFHKLIDTLKELGFQIVMKEHNKQGKDKDENDDFKFPNIEGVDKVAGEIYPILQNNDYDFIISDHSSLLLDAIFFKNKVIYFDPNNNTQGYITQYSKYLTNLYSENLSSLSKNSFYELLSIGKQEALFNNMVSKGNNEVELVMNFNN